jgi:hypothetical protein
MRDLDRTLAFTALLNLSPEFAESTAMRGSLTITLFLEEYYEWLDGRPFVAGRDDIYSFAKRWVKDNKEA